MKFDFDAVIIGAGVIGLSCARSLAKEGQNILILERNDRIAAEGSARNSEVIHAGLYYPHNSRKHRFCIAGAAMLYEYLKKRHIDHKRIGKFIVANGVDDDQKLQALQSNAQSNGVEGLTWLSPTQLLKYEPDIQCSNALFSPNTGIFDSHAYAFSLLAEVEEHGGILALNSPVQSIRCMNTGFQIECGPDRHRITAHRLINAAGIWAEHVARDIKGLDPLFIPTIRYIKGHYAQLQGARASFQHLIYPVPGEKGLGIHVTLDLGGQCRFGPDALAPHNHVDYIYEHGSLDHFYKAIRRYWPNLPDNSLVPSMVGIRPKLNISTGSDFHISDPEEHGISGLVNLFGIESPGLTSSLAIGKEVAALLD